MQIVRKLGHRKTAPPHELPRADLLLDILHRIDFAREQMRRAEHRLHHTLNDLALDDDFEDWQDQELEQHELATLQRGWAQFRGDGGCTRADLERWLKGEAVGRKPARHKGHLRLVANKPRKQRVKLNPRPN